MKEVWKYIQSDYYRYSGKIESPLKLFIKAVFSINHCYRYSFWMRMAACTGGGYWLHFQKVTPLLHNKIWYTDPIYD